MAEINDSDKLNLALELMSDDDVEKFTEILDIVEEKNIDIYAAMDIYGEKHEQ